MKGSDYSILATSAQYRESAAFWRGQLTDPATLFDALPTGRDRTSGRHSIEIRLNQRTAARIAALANDAIGRFTVLSAGIALALSRYLNRDRVLLRTPALSAGRGLSDVHEVPLVFTAAAAMTVREFLEQAAEMVADSFEFQEFPVRVLGIEECRCDFVERAEFSLSCDTVQPEPLRPASPVHFCLDAMDAGRVTITFDSSAVTSPVMEVLADVLTATLDRIADLDQTLRDVERVPPGQRTLLIDTWSHTAIDDRPFRSIHELFEARARQAPEATAIRFGAEAMSYRELDERANGLAHHLATTVDPSECAVGIWMDRSPWMVVSVLGVLKAGLAYVPIDADCPPGRLEFLLRDSGVRRLLTDERRSATALALGCAVILAAQTADPVPHGPAVSVRPADLAYILYTSGSTGQPKGCAIEHHSLTNYLQWAMAFYWNAPETGTMGLFTPLSFDLTVPSLFCPLLRGRSLVVFPQDAAMDDILHQQFDGASGIDSVKLTPSHIQLLDPDRVRQSNVQLAIVGGEALTTEHVSRLRRINPRMRVINEYGPTETTVGCIVKDVASDDPITIGRPITNAYAYVLDAEQRPVPIGVTGELCVGGAGVARGYVGRPELDAGRFLPNPFVPGGRIYRTGDLARWLPDGELECFGRIDDQVKVRGYRIEPGEIESALMRCDGIREAVVVAMAGELVAYVGSDEDVDPLALRRALRDTLPQYMVPATIVRVPHLPLTANGKVDRARLPSPAVVAPGTRPYIPPRAPHEVVLARIWSGVFRRDRIGVDENFFELGGHSLRAMTIIQRIHQELGLDVSIGEVLGYPTIAALAAVLAARGPASASTIRATPAAAHYAVSHGQRRLWLINRIDEASPAYNVPAAFELEGTLDLQSLRDAVADVSARHESLRTAFIDVHGEPRQQVAGGPQVAFEYADLRTDAGREQTLATRVAAQAARPFDLATGPLVRVGAFQLGERRWTLTLVLHHIISDAWSIRVLMADLIALYESRRTGAVAGLTPLTLHYRDYATWQRAWMDSDGARASRDYWKAKLRGALRPLVVPGDFPRPALPTYRGRHHHAEITGGAIARLRALGAAVGASPFMTLVAIVKALLYRYSGESDIRVGAPIAGRAQAELANQIGFYVNTLVLRDDVRGDEPFQTLLGRVKRTAEEGYTHQAYPFDRLVDDLDVVRDLSRTPLFDVMVVHDSAPDPVATAGDLAVTERRMETGVSKFDLTFAFAESDAGLAIEIEYSTDLFVPERIATMSGDLIRLIEQAVVWPETRIDDFDLSELGRTPRLSSPDVPAIEARSTRPADRVAPRDTRELQLVGQIEAVLGQRDVSVFDNFFHIGGDSITAIQIVSRLAARGWHLRVRDLFEAPEIAALAARLSPAAQARVQSPAEGPVPLTPIQRWFFATQPEGRHHYNQSVMLRFPDRLDETVIGDIGRALVRHHASLRLRFATTADGISQSYGEAYDPFERHDLRDASDPIAAITRVASRAQSGLDLERGRLFTLMLLQLPGDDRLLAVAHHLAVDGVSWRILLDDLRAGLEQAARHEPVALGAVTDSYQAWSLALAAHRPVAALETRWWQDVDDTPVMAFPFDTACDAPLESELREQRLTLSTAATEALFTEVNHAYNTRTQDVLLAGLGRALSEWAGPGPVRVDLESHGREGLDGVDASRTVGWFTALFPIILDVGTTGDEGLELIRVKDALRRIPGHGLGYGLLRDGRHSGAAIVFNFLGQFDTDLGGFVIADEDRGPESGPHAQATHALSVGGFVAQGQLHMTVRYSPSQFQDSTVARLVQAYEAALTALIAHCRERTVPQRTLSDFRYTDRSTGALVTRLGSDRVTDVYPLSPMQQGMLFHRALDGTSGVYVEQLSCTIAGPLDIPAFRAAWASVIGRHDALRTACFWEDVEQPVQVVFANVDAPWVFHDWRGVHADEQQAHLDAFAWRDQRESPPLDTPPLFRLTLIRLSEERCRFYWTAHHLILDGWSTATVLQEVFAAYDAAMAGAPASVHAAHQFGDYIDWLRAQDTTAARTYWRTHLADASVPTPLPAAPRAPAGAGGSAFATATLVFTVDETARVTRAARERALTLNTLARGAWALLLAAHAARTEVVFGVTVSGRPADLRGVESIVGLFINTVPIRVTLDATATLEASLRRIQIDHADLDQYAFSALTDIQQQSGHPSRVPLFESILVFENFPVDQSIEPGRHRLAIDDLSMAEQTNYPLTLVVVPDEELLVRLSYDTSRYDADTAAALLAQFRKTFDAFVLDPQQAVAPMLGTLSSTPASARHRVILEDHTLDALRAVALREGTSPASVLRAAIAIACFRYSGHEDLHCMCGPDRLRREHVIGDRPLSATLDAVNTRHPESGETTGTAPIDLQFDLVELPGRLVVDMSCPSGRFDQHFLNRIGGHLATLTGALAAAADVAVAHLPILPPDERARLLSGFNQTARDWGGTDTIVQHFEGQAARDPDRVAVVMPAHGREGAAADDTWTYGALNEQANQLARLLVRDHGVGPDVRVGVLAERSFAMVLALVAVQKAGGAYVPLDPDYPADLLRFMREDAGATVVLTQQRFAELAGTLHSAIVVLDGPSDILSGQERHNLSSTVTGDHLSYVIYTSGSTGRPKGAMNTHRGIANRLLWMQDAYRLTADDRVLQKTPFSFDVSVWEFFWPLMVGAQLVIAKPGGHRDAAYLVSLIEAAGITTMHFVPSMLQAFIDEPDLGRCRTLARVICSGEAITPELLRRYLARMPVPLHNLYGPTEAAVDVTAWACSAADTQGMVPIGRPIANIRLYIVDGALQPVPEGVTGELLLGGVGIGRGYLNRPELTEAKFIPDPYDSTPGARLYRTGDLARYRRDGAVDFLGRIDHQVKLRGFRIELGEIESVLLSHAGVRECVVVVREDQPGVQRLVAYVVASAEAGGMPADLSRWLHRTLPDHMVPTAFVALHELPRLTNGKLDRNALPAADAAPATGRRHQAPRDDGERRLVRVWQEVLGLQTIGVTDDFFDLGGHSILALKLVGAIHREFGRSVPLVQILEHPTIERLAVALKTGHSTDDWRPLVELRPGAGGAPLFLLPGAGGNVVYFHSLVQHLAPARRVYGLQAVGLDGRTSALTSVEAIAAMNVDEIIRVWPDGPYLLAGHSFGGRVALEMAQQLARQGRRVALLAALDTAAPTFTPDEHAAVWTDAEWLWKIAREIQESFGVRWSLTLDDLAPLTLDAQLRLVIDQMQRAGALAPGTDPGQLRGYLEVYKANSQAAYLRYDATRARVPMALVKAMERDADLEAVPASLIELTARPDWGWQEFAEGPVRVVEVPGAHLSMLTEPHVQTLARAVDAMVEAALDAATDEGA